jgi:hypothetical protein
MGHERHHHPGRPLRHPLDPEEAARAFGPAARKAEPDDCPHSGWAAVWRQTMWRVICVVIGALVIAGCGREKDPDQAAFEKRFEREAILAKTCSPDPGFVSGPTASSTKVYRFRKELLFYDGGVLRRVDAQPENACDILQET